MEDKPRKCVLNEDHSVHLSDILVSFNAPISEEHAWALCYQCAKCFRNEFKSNRKKCRLVSQLDQVLIHKDGHVHPNTIFAGGGENASDRDSDAEQTERSIVAGLGLVLFRALDFGIDDDLERDLSPELSRLIQNMTDSVGSEERQINETDDEGIERDADESEEESQQPPRTSLALVLQECTVHLGCGGTQEADTHYRAVCRALVAEALELSTFLENVGTRQMRPQQDPPDHLDKLNLNDWAKLWLQVIRELRMGVQLKKVCYTRKPIEYELTPYEILMEDIRSRRYKLNKVMVDGNIPNRVKKDAHAIILEFIRSRPPLRKASERRLKPAVVTSTPREKLLESIKQGDIHLTPIRRNSRREDTTDALDSNSGIRHSKRIIKIDYSKLDTDDDDEELGIRTEDEDDEPRVETNVDADGKASNNGNNPWQRTGSLRLSKAEIDHYCDTALQPYDLATQCPSIRASMRRHTVVVCEAGNKGSLSVPQSRPSSQLTNNNSPTDESLSCTLPEMTWSRTSLQDDLFKSKQWQEECLSLTLEEIVHIRSVLTKAELESLPVEGRVKEDAEKRKVCFLCMKTRFGIFGPWGQICKLCKRTVCAKCYSKMRIPTEHFSHVPVVALSPSLLSPTEIDDSFPRALVSKLMSGSTGSGSGGGGAGTVGSAPASPKISRSTPPATMSTSLYSHGPMSLPSSSPSFSGPGSTYDKWRIARSKALSRQKAEKLKGLQMIVCHDCKTMVLQIIKSSRTSRNNAIRNLTLDLSPVY